MAISWSTLENALTAAVKSASGFASGQVVWSDQTSDTPSGSYITLKLGAILTDPSAVPVHTHSTSGDTTTHTFRTPKDFTLSIQVFTPTVRGDASARAIASQVQSKLVLPAIRNALNAAGLSLLDVGAVQYVPAIKGTKFEGRAILEPRFLAFDTATETSSWIETVNTLDYSGPPLGTANEIDIP